MTDHRAKLQAKVAFWRRESARLERDRMRLHYVVALGVVAAIAIYGTTGNEALAALTLALTLSIYALGTYMVVVRRQEQAAAVAEVEAKLAPLAQAGPQGGQTPDKDS